MQCFFIFELLNWFKTTGKNLAMIYFFIFLKIIRYFYKIFSLWILCHSLFLVTFHFSHKYHESIQYLLTFELINWSKTTRKKLGLSKYFLLCDAVFFAQNPKTASYRRTSQNDMNFLKKVCIEHRWIYVIDFLF